MKISLFFLTLIVLQSICCKANSDEEMDEQTNDSQDADSDYDSDACLPKNKRELTITERIAVGLGDPAQCESRMKNRQSASMESQQDDAGEEESSTENPSSNEN